MLNNFSYINLASKGKTAQKSWWQNCWTKFFRSYKILVKNPLQRFAAVPLSPLIEIATKRKILQTKTLQDFLFFEKGQNKNTLMKIFQDHNDRMDQLEGNDYTLK